MMRSIKPSRLKSVRAAPPSHWRVTYFLILPTNARLMALEPATRGAEARNLIKGWGSLHAIRTLLSFAAVVAFGLALAD